MKQVSYLFLFFYLNITAQNDSLSSIKSNLSIVSTDNINVIYRGVSNPISVAVPNCKSFDATGLGLTKVKEGKYNLKPGQGLYSIIKIDIELKDGSKITEEHKFRIRDLDHPLATINNRKCGTECVIEMTKEELYNSIIGYSFPNDFIFDLNFTKYKINGFIVKFSNNKKVTIEGNSFNNDINNIVKKLKKGSIFVIDDVSYSFPGSENYLLPRLIPIKVIIVEKQVQENYFENKEFKRDSIKRIKNEKKLLKR
ncbi:GldM family protein [Flavobacterium mesophilum]|uniref:GldM family protein n=1 Tax=Flavobacterium mesophilum TaxID=3143495 RepID=UPI0031DAF0EB